MRVWKPGQHAGLEAYEGHGKQYDLRMDGGENVGREWMRRA